jgi:hypothetical protein
MIPIVCTPLPSRLAASITISSQHERRFEQYRQTKRPKRSQKLQKDIKARRCPSWLTGLTECRYRKLNTRARLWRTEIVGAIVETNTMPKQPEAISVVDHLLVVAAADLSLDLESCFLVFAAHPVRPERVSNIRFTDAIENTYP